MRRVSSEVGLNCRCGKLRGVARKVAPNAGFRFTCYCKDCQAFARFLGRPDVLDAAGGTDIFQMPTGRVRFTDGEDVIACLRFPGSKVLRWYAACCRTPIGNTAGADFPMLGVIHSFMDHASSGRSRTEALGPPLCRIFEGSATGPLAPGAPPRPTFGVFMNRLSKVLSWQMRGLGKPNPFFDLKGAARAVPHTLSKQERAALDT